MIWLADAETTDDLYVSLTTEPNARVGVVHPKAMPVILTKPEESATWLSAPWPDDTLVVVARGARRDGRADDMG